MRIERSILNLIEREDYFLSYYDGYEVEVVVMCHLDKKEVIELIYEKDAIQLKKLKREVIKRYREKGIKIPFPTYEQAYNHILKIHDKEISKRDYELFKEWFFENVEIKYRTIDFNLQVYLEEYIRKVIFNDTIESHQVDLIKTLDIHSKSKLLFKRSFKDLGVFQLVEKESFMEWLKTLHIEKEEWNEEDYIELLNEDTLNSFIQYFNLSEYFIVKVKGGYVINIAELEGK